jgi:hypothetical protein
MNFLLIIFTDFSKMTTGEEKLATTQGLCGGVWGIFNSLADTYETYWLLY